MIVPAVMALAAATTTPAAAVPLKPIGRWVVDYRDDMCLVARSFGSESDPTIFALKPSVSIDSRSADLFVLVPWTGDKTIRRGTAMVTFQPSGTTKKLDYVSWVPADSQQRGYEVPLIGDLIDTLRQSTALQVDIGKDSVAAATGKIEPVMTALGTCIDDLYRSWGVDPTARAVPAQNPGIWFTNDDYPAEARRAGASGRVIILLTVAPDGKSTACRVIESAKEKSLDAATCDLATRRSRFQASTGSGNRYSVLSIAWHLFNR
jgi:TonB family protein